MGHKNTRWALLSSITLALAAFAPPAAALLTEPNAMTVPVLTGESQYLVLQTLFDSRNEQINWQTDVQSGPGVFSPLCAFSGTLLLHGGGCKMDLGWYNVVPGSTTPPTDAEIYTLVPANDPTIDLFLPNLVTVDRQKQFPSDIIRNDTRYNGGQIGFALRKAAATCTQTKFSQNQFNTVCTDCTTPGPWISTVFYKSTVTPNAYYVGFEDLPMKPDGTGCDFDFNDFFYFITGLSCEGAGQPCTVPDVKGVCALGKTDCAPTGGTPVCREVFKPTKEVCDNVDNDCNGQIDDGDICDPGYVCDRGTCVHACGGAEFPCPTDLICNDRGYCVDPLCLTVTCPAEQVCRKGKCVAKCDGIVCPKNQECQNGKCIDLCDGVTCPAETVCEQGVCIPSCSCAPCVKPKVCLSSGHCADEACKLINCPDFNVCENGQCTDVCKGAVCPGGGACTKGKCQDAPIDSGTGTGGAGTGGGPAFEGGVVLPPSGGAAGTSSGAGGSGATGGAPATGGSAGGSAATFGPDRAAASSGCNCNLSDRNGAGTLAAIGGVLLVAAGARRRRRPRV